MGKKKVVILAGICICVLLVTFSVFLLQPDNGGEENKTGENDKIVTLEQVKEQFAADIAELKNGKYPNLIAKDFNASIEDAESLCKFQILRNQEFETTLENVGTMIEALDKFFGDSLDKAKLFHEVYILDEDGELPADAWGEEISYDAMMKLLTEGNEKTYSFRNGFVYRGEGYAHIYPSFSNTWFSKRSLGSAMPGDYEHTKEYLYVTGVRQEDATIQLQDKSYSLAELEQKVMDYVNGEKFPLPHHEELSYQIGTAHVITEEIEYINFVLRRVYKGVPFEYGSESSSDEYIDEEGHDYTRVNYVEGTSPDTIMGFMDLKGAIEVLEDLAEMIPAREALRLLSEQIGENSVYDVYGVELVYRNCQVPEDKRTEIADILEPKWKIITINQNDDKYTLFYVDVVTGEITDRFEYYYD